MQPIADRVLDNEVWGIQAGGRCLLCLHDGSHRGLNGDRTRTLALELAAALE
jgi:hypothetical protein